MVWPPLGMTGLVINFGVSLNYIHATQTLEVLAYSVLWFAGPGLGFAITATFISGPRAGYSGEPSTAGTEAESYGPPCMLADLLKTQPAAPAAGRRYRRSYQHRL